jgi:hypothetical protein
LRRPVGGRDREGEVRLPVGLCVRAWVEYGVRERRKGSGSSPAVGEDGGEGGAAAGEARVEGDLLGGAAEQYYERDQGDQHVDGDELRGTEPRPEAHAAPGEQDEDAERDAADRRQVGEEPEDERDADR